MKSLLKIIFTVTIFEEKMSALWNSFAQTVRKHFRQPLSKRKRYNNFEQNQSLEGVEDKMSTLWNSFAQTVRKHFRQR